MRLEVFCPLANATSHAYLIFCIMHCLYFIRHFFCCRSLSTFYSSRLLLLFHFITLAMPLT
ncbi:hypothetical protein BGX38DRAFT_1225259 [Terfezia claveryi]|nr:hypothetical protein BGX38DRAFT_1225259 [Terfezia claveryi]